MGRRCAEQHIEKGVGNDLVRLSADDRRAFSDRPTRGAA